MTVHATTDDLDDWLTGGDYPVPTGTTGTRLLARASELVDSYTVGMIVDPAPDTVTAALRDATCAQVEQWLDVGESNAIAGYPRDTAMAATGVSRLPSVLAPRAVALLVAEGIYNPPLTGPDGTMAAPIRVEAV